MRSSIVAACALYVTACAPDSPGLLVYVDAQMWGREHARTIEAVVRGPDGDQIFQHSFALTGPERVQLPLRIWVRPSPRGSTQEILLEAVLRGPSGEVLVAAVAPGKVTAELRAALLCLEDGCHTIACSTASECALDPAACRRCVGGACAPAALVPLAYESELRCPGTRGVERACFDGADDDRDGPVDCDDDDCADRACDGDGDGRATGELCIGGACVCPEGASTEVACADGRDDDCDGLVDCGDAECADGTPCDDRSRVCMGGRCVCPGAAETETDCGNGADDDCDGATDCDDLDCGGSICGPNGLTCIDGECACPLGAAAEKTCDDGEDNDCDGLSDCEDPDCDRERAPGGSNFVCCGTTPTNISRRTSCGGCGIECATDRYCHPEDRETAIGWVCSCDEDTDCPGYPDQYCLSALRRCSCRNDAAGCDIGQSCSREMDDVNFCHYDWNS